SASSNLALIRQLARPGIVTLSDENGQPAHALLTGLSPQSATLRMGGVSQTVSLASLARLWRGDFATYWRVPPGYQSGIVEADAERERGSVPGIHAQPLPLAAADDEADRAAMPWLWIATGVAVMLGGVLVWRMTASDGPQPAPVAAMPAAAPLPAPTPVPAPPP